MTRHALTLLLGGGLAVALVACGSARRDATAPGFAAFALQDPKLAEGQRAFMFACNQCHPRGEAGLGPALNNKPLPGALIRTQIRRGLGAMPSFDAQALSDAEVDAIVAYVHHLRDGGRPPSSRGTRY